MEKGKEEQGRGVEGDRVSVVKTGMRWVSLLLAVYLLLANEHLVHVCSVAQSYQTLLPHGL